MPSDLPSKRAFVTALCASIKLGTSNADNPLDLHQQDQRDAFLTLHSIFPSELLAALDLMDRKLITKVVCKQRPDSRVGSREPWQSAATYLVQSAQAEPSDASARTTPMAAGISESPIQELQQPTAELVYEVSLASWNCSCPAFVFAAFPPDVDVVGFEQNQHVHSVDAGEVGAPSYGGCSLDSRLADETGSVPVCKHILACYLLERGEFGSSISMRTREITTDEMAGWAAGWAS
ncbi:hypothetical protein P152DRAFT_456718 [Eremomyces bilateralis CBS 781.70]|uniref:SWIM-type domain-containing protein n=1 Tax=Eremomyces bilateralis CBS 781.70 TaxID=1392243 RepID=A0A6G1G958_9PEZI|nr:uncharacterized protein P152DRAFT_456718 [Eremomyces bilateralis CBS 781.70]KAF1814466.1 hypothetical protein P152DRAFT_456718 [Eremomyces bilateralis CBS 781.70]